MNEGMVPPRRGAARAGRGGPLIYLNEGDGACARLPSRWRRGETPPGTFPMVSLILAEDLLRAARDAASAPLVRDAVRELALRALRSRSLTPQHIASVVRAVGEGIGSCTLAQAAAVREVQRGAWEGLAEAVDQALYAYELAARNLDEEWAVFPAGDRDEVVREFQELERELSRGGTGERLLTEEFRARLATVIGLLRSAEAGEAVGRGAAPVADARLLSMVASGVLLGLTAAPRPGLAG
jgi:hypothetical protein